MTSNEILRADLLDILFDRRNKEYGAYTLRKFYDGRLALSLGLALSIAFLLFFFTRFHHTESVAATGNRDVVVRQIIIAQPPPEKVQPPKPIVPRTSVAAPTAKLTDQIKITKNAADIADIDQLKQALVSNTTNHLPFTGDLPPTPPAPVVSATPDPATAAPPPPAALVQREPEFPGGTSAWRNFLERNLQSPSDLGPGERKTVVMRFLVSAEGVVTGFEVMQSGGRDYDEEVMRVLRRMPKWKPALVNSQPVARSFTQPVTFVGQEQ